MTTTSPIPDGWTLCHAWHSDSDRAALALCAAELAKAGLEFRETSDAGAADAIKMHGFELVDAVGDGILRPVDLRDVAAAGNWQRRIDPRAWQFMEHGGAVHGIPVAIHQSNCLWAHAQAAAEVASDGHGGTQDLSAWLRAAARHRAAPLAIGSEPWQIGILFESLCLAIGGAQFVREAFVQLSPDALGGAAMREVLERLVELRDYVDDDRLALPWRTQLDDVRTGRAAVMVMGDWVRAALPAGVERLHVEGFREEATFIVDFFVPVAGHGSAGSGRAAAAHTPAPFQSRLSAIKGSVAAVLEAQDASPAPARRIDAPSLTFDQCCSVSKKVALLGVVTEHFLERRLPAQTASALAVIAAS